MHSLKKIAPLIAGILSLAILIVLGLAARMPDHQRYERKRVIAAAAAKIFEHIRDLHAWESWSPWAKIDSQMKKSYEGTTGEVGSSYAWAGNKEVGTGKMTLMSFEAPKQILFKLEFFEPFADVQDTEFLLTESVSSDGKISTEVTWSMFGPVRFSGKIMHVFMNMDTMIGESFDKGLADLEKVVM